MKKIVIGVFLFMCTNLIFGQFNGITGVGQGINISNYNNITTNFASLYPIADTVTTIVIQEDVDAPGFTTGINTSSPTLFWEVNLPTVAPAGDSMWHAVAGTIISGSVDGTTNDRLEFRIPVGITNAGDVPPGTDLMYYIQVNDDANKVVRYAFASTSSFPTTLPSLTPSDLWRLRANNVVTYNTKRMDALFYDWQPNERIDTLDNGKNGEASEIRTSWNDQYIFQYVDKLSNWNSTEAVFIYLNTDNDTTNGGREGVTLNGLTPLLPFRYDYVAVIKPVVGSVSTDLRPFAARNTYTGFQIPYSFNDANDILELELERTALGAADTNVVANMFMYIADTVSGNIITTWPSTSQDISGTNDGGIDFNAGIPRWFSYKLAPGQVPGVTESILPVELTSFTGTLLNNKVTLYWTTATEINNYGFDIERSFDKIKWDKVGFVQGNGISNSPKNYSFVDDNVKFTSKIQYRLKQIDNNGAYKYSQVVEVQGGSFLNGYLLDQNYPNPFNPSTTIKFGFENNTKAELKIYDILGNEVTVLFNGSADAGRIYDVQFNASKYASGIYYYKLTGDNKTEIKKMILLK